MIEIARRTGHSKPYIRARIGLAFLAPDLQAAILEGRQPASLSVAQFTRNDRPMDWTAQRRLFGDIWHDGSGLKKVFDFANTERTVRSGGVSETLTNFEIMLRKQFEAGVAEKTLAQRDHLELFQRAEQARSHHIKDQCERLTKIKEAHQRIIDRAKAAKTPIPRVLPHPDDIIIDWIEGVRIPGPIDEEDWKRFDQTARVRDALFMQQAMEDCLNRVRTSDRPTLGGAGLLGFFFNETLPPSLRMSEFAWIDRISRLSRISKRDILKQSRAAWSALGARVARGKQFGSAEKLKPMLTAMFDLAKACIDQKTDPQGYIEALEDCAFAINEFRASAPKLAAASGAISGNGESAA